MRRGVRLRFRLDAALAFAQAKNIRVPAISFVADAPHVLAHYNAATDRLYINSCAASLGSVTPGYLSTAHRFHPFLHELGHCAHHDHVGARYHDLATVHDGLTGVSRYAETNGLEFVAEVFVGLVTGQHYADAVMNRYRELGGPHDRIA